MDWFITALKKYAQFSGRSQRAEYWYFILFYTLIYLALAIVDGVTGTFSLEDGFGLLSGLFALAMLIPSIAVSVRRLHDTGRSGWWFLIGLIPIVGSIILLVFFVQDSEAGDNAYGANPKAPATVVSG
ncbi:DUF805 domain-containing protein [Solimonas marina]|uniref:DUF805 domain-containing protein n=1 Tax=Solimonas marina TaxID=2714601 RepID=A0A969WC90_9GAMM|nr:DUF805 domain-containing protein [Solimonas marina]NKF23893.1 DUF805 domain-containing protein [Solimonas marina]